MGNAGDLFHELHYVYKDKCNAKKDALNRKDKNKFYYTKLRLTNDYLYESEEEEEKQADKIPDKKEPPKKSTKSHAKELMNWLLKKKHAWAGIISKTFQLSDANCNAKGCI